MKIKMNIDEVENRIKMCLYGEKYSRGVLEFSWGRDNDPEKFNQRLVAAKSDCSKIGIKWVDADPMSAKIVIVCPKEQSKSVIEIMSQYGFDCINKIFDPESTENLGGWDTP
jgi:hypothetical protein